MTLSVAPKSRLKRKNSISCDFGCASVRGFCVCGSASRIENRAGWAGRMSEPSLANHVTQSFVVGIQGKNACLRSSCVSRPTNNPCPSAFPDIPTSISLCQRRAPIQRTIKHHLPTALALLISSDQANHQNNLPFTVKHGWYELKTPK